MQFLRRALWLLSLSGAVGLGAQTINVNQIRPSSTANQVITTTAPNAAPSWQPGASATGTAPITVNGLSGTPETTPFTIACPECGSGAFASQVVVPFVPGVQTINVNATQNAATSVAPFFASSSNTSGQLGNANCNPGTTPACTPGANETSITWTGFTLPAGITSSNYVGVQAYLSGTSNGVVDQALPVVACTAPGGGGSANFTFPGNTGNFPSSPLTANFSPPVPFADVAGIVCTTAAAIIDSSANAKVFNIDQINLIVTYTGAPIANPTTIAVAPCLTLNTSTELLGFNSVCNYAGTSGGSADAYALSLPGSVLSLEQPSIPPQIGQEVLWTPSFANTTTTPSLNLNGSGAVTITKGPGHTAVAAGDINGNVADVIFDGSDWELQNPQTSSGGGSGSISVNGTSVSSPNLNGATPAAPSGSTNCTWAVSGSSVSCSIPTTSSGGVTLTGPVTGSGTGTVATTITPTGVTAGSYTNPNITLNAAGQVTAASNGSGTSGITQLTADVTTPTGGGSQPATAVNLPGHIALSGTPSAGQVPTATSPTAATWQTPTAGSSTGVIHTGVGPPSQGTAATITHVQSAATTVGGSGSVTSFGSNVTAGDLIVVLQNGEDGMTNTLTPTDTLGTSFQLLGSAESSGPPATPEIAIWGGIAPASGADTVSWNATGVDNPTTAIDELSGVLLSVDVSAAPVFNLANPATSLTPRIAGDLVIGFGEWIWSNGVPVTFTPGSGFILGGNFTGASAADPLANEYLLDGTASLTNVTISQTPNTGGQSVFGAVSLFAQHSGSIGNDGDFYLDSSTGFLYGPRTNGIYLRFGAGLGVVGADGTSITNTNGIISAVPGGGGPLFKQYTFVAQQTTSLPSITSPAITVAASDLLMVLCQAGTNLGPTSNATDTLGNTYSAPSMVSGLGIQMNWVISASAGSDAFTCTPSAAETQMSMVVLDFSGTGATLNTSASVVNGSAGDFAKFNFIPGPAFTTTQRTLDIMCAAADELDGAFTPWITGPGFGVLAGVSSGSLTDNVNDGCEYEIVPNASQSAGNALLYSNTSSSSSVEVIAVNY